MARKVWTGSNRLEILKRIFTEGVKQCAKDNGLTLSEALAAMIGKNKPLWEEYRSGTLPVQGAMPEGHASATLASEASTYARENHISFSVAFGEVCKSRPDLFKKFQEEIPIVI